MKDLVEALKCNFCKGRDDCEVYQVIREYYCNFEAKRNCESCKHAYVSTGDEPCSSCREHKNWEADNET